MEGAAELGQFLQYGRDAVAQSVDDGGHHGLAAASVGVSVGGDHALIEAPAQFDREMGLVSEYGFQPGSLAGSEQR